VAATHLPDSDQFFADYENCRKFMIAMRWEDGVVRCPQCNSSKVSSGNFLAEQTLLRNGIYPLP
jgi:hypothetical protein